MATVALTVDNFQDHVEKPGILLIDWWATWCGPCRTFAPIYEEASARHADAVFAKIDTDEQSELAGKFGIQSIPTLMVFRDQILVFARPGLLPGSALDELIGKVKALDMDDVRKQIAAAEAQEGEESESDDDESHYPAHPAIPSHFWTTSTVEIFQPSGCRTATERSR